MSSCHRQRQCRRLSRSLLAWSGLLWVLLSGTVHAWWDDAYDCRMPVSVSNTSASALTNYELALSLDSTTLAAQVWDNDGADIRFIADDDLTPLDFWIQHIDSVNQTLNVWVKVPALPADGAASLWLYYCNVDAQSASDASAVFSHSGVKFHSRRADVDLIDRDHALATFNTAGDDAAGYGCTHLDDYTGVDHSDLFGASQDVISRGQAFFEVEDGDAGEWQFRFGPDYGVGGELYVDEQTVEADWDSDLWWEEDFTHPLTLSGSITLDAGFHELNFIGADDCCDGATSLEFLRPGGGVWQPFSVDHLNIDSRQCVDVEVNASVGGNETLPISLAMIKSNPTSTGKLRFAWATAAQSFTLGFHLWAQVDGQWHQLNPSIIAAKALDSVTTRRYEFTAVPDFDVAAISGVGLSSVDVNGDEAFYGPFDLGERYGSETLPSPVDWSAIRESHRRAMMARGYVKIGKRWVDSARVTQLRYRTQRDAQPVVDVHTTQPGVYRIEFSQLREAGLALDDIPNAWIALTHNGEPHQRQIMSVKGGRDRALVFHAQGLAAAHKLHTAEDVYRIEVDANLVLSTRRINRTPKATLSQYTEQVTVDENNIYSPYIPVDDPWVADALLANGSEQRLTLKVFADDVIDDQPAALQVNLIGVTDWHDNALDHHVQLLSDSGETLWDEYADGLHVWPLAGGDGVPLSPGEVRNGENTFTLRLPGDTGSAYDMVYVDSYQLRYRRSLKARNDHLSFQGEPGVDGYKVKGFSRPVKWAYATSEDGHFVRLRVNNMRTRNNGYAAIIPSVRSRVAHYWLAADKSAFLSAPVSPAPAPTEILPQSGEDYVIVAHPLFIDRFLQPGDRADFVAAREADGYNVKVVNVDDVYAQYGHGMAVPEAITSFLRDAEALSPGLHVLLVGAASKDPAGYLAEDHDNRSINYIPTVYAWSHYRLDTRTPSDGLMADTDGDGVQDVAIGRWDVFNHHELDVIIDKTLAYQRNAVGQNDTALMLADNNDVAQGLSFKRQLERVGAALMRYDGEQSLPWQGVELLDFDTLIDSAGGDVGSAAAAARQTMVQRLNAGTAMTVFAGHGSPTAWSRNGLLNFGQVGPLNRADASTMLLALTCYNSVYNEPTSKTLGHRLLFGDGESAPSSQTGGAVVVMGAVSLSSYYNNEIMTRHVLDAMLRDGYSIGEAVVMAKQRLGDAFGNLQVGWQLNGDPALRIGH